jgi:soluble lytic murein transglycosylase
MQFRKVLLAAVAAGMLAGCVRSSSGPTSLPSQEPTASPIFQATETAATPLPSPTPWPTVTPTTAPTAAIQAADRAFFLGDWDSAMTLYQDATERSADQLEQALGLYGQARLHLLQNDPSRALNVLRELIENYPFSPQLPEAHYFLGRTFDQLQRYEESALAYEVYLVGRPNVLDQFVYELAGDAHLKAGNPEAAQLAYEQALSADQLAPADALQLKLAGAERQQDLDIDALSRLRSLNELSVNDFILAESNYIQAEILIGQSDLESAAALYQQNVANYPVAHFSFLSLQALDFHGIPVDEFDRGLVLYFAGELGSAISAFERFLSTAPAEHDGAAHHYQALALRQIGSTDRAAAEWQTLVDTHPPEDPYWMAAWDELGYTQWAFQDEPAAAVETFSGFVDAQPEHAAAVEFLAAAAWVAERDGQLQVAIDLWRKIDLDYPIDPGAYRAAFLVGIGEYRLGNFPAALDSFRRASQIASAPGDQAAAFYWIGKSEAALGFSEAAASTWQQTASLDPTGYYSERALDLLLERDPFDPPQTYDFVVDWNAERAQAEDWIKATFGLDQGIELSGLGALQDDPRLIRGTAYWHLGEFERARLEVEALRQAISFDPAGNYRLSSYLLELGMYRTAIFSARQVLNLAGMDDAQTLGAPAYFNHVRFGLYFQELVLVHAQDAGIHPLLIYSLMRQESLFEGFVRSSAGARGLMQILPTTGQQIANNLGWPTNYESGDLYRPFINVAFGVDYLDDQFSSLDENPYAALAAYNAGPGNAGAWIELSPDDPDLFLEIVRFSETRNYIRGVYEIFSLYRRIYDRTP